MPLYPPPQPVEHPADLVIDTFGTYLGRRSERMVVRWRDEDETASVQDSVVSGESMMATNGNGFSGASEETEGCAGSGPSSQPVDEGSRSFPSPALDSSSSPLEVATGDGVAGQASTEGSRGVPSPSEEAAARLLQFWSQQSPPLDQPRPSPRVRLQESLQRVAEPSVSQGAYAQKKSGTWRERVVPLSRLRSVTVTGRGITISSDLIAALVERGISLSFLTGRGDPVAQLSSPGLGGTVQTRRSQIAAADSPLGVQLAVEFIRGKLRNQKHQLQYSGKYLKASDPARYERLVRKIKAMAGLRKQLREFQAESLSAVRDKLMGYEGTGARVYWEGVTILLEGRVEFPGRSTRGAIDPVNSALNYGYGILYGQVSGAVVNAGLELYAGFLHVDRPGKPSLVLDLVEEFRAPIVDRTILAIINQGIAIETDDHGLTTSTRKLISHRILERLSTPVPYEGKRWPLGTIIQNQARHLAVAVRGERDYRAFASRW